MSISEEDIAYKGGVVQIFELNKTFNSVVGKGNQSMAPSYPSDYALRNNQCFLFDFDAYIDREEKLKKVVEFQTVNYHSALAQFMSHNELILSHVCVGGINQQIVTHSGSCCYFYEKLLIVYMQKEMFKLCN